MYGTIYITISHVIIFKKVDLGDGIHIDSEIWDRILRSSSSWTILCKTLMPNLLTEDELLERSVTGKVSNA